MNKEEIDKWLDNEYGCSYTRLEELHDYYFEKYTDQKKEIDRLNNIINELEEYLFSQLQEYGGGGFVQEYYDKLKELKENK